MFLTILLCLPVLSGCRTTDTTNFINSFNDGLNRNKMSYYERQQLAIQRQQLELQKKQYRQTLFQPIQPTIITPNNTHTRCYQMGDQIHCDSY